MQPQLEPESDVVPAPSEIRGLLTIFFSPADTFIPSGSRAWLVPLLACVVIAILLNVMVVQVVGMGTLTRNQLESNPKIADALGPEGVNEAVRKAESNAGQKALAIAGAGVSVVVLVSIVAGLTYGLLMATGAVTEYSAVLAACSWATYATLVVTFLGSAAFLAFVKDYSGIDPGGMLMLNASIFVNRASSPAWVRSLASSVDLVKFWAMFLQVIGLQRLSRQVSAAQAITAVVVVYILGVLLRVGWSVIFS